MKEELGHVRAGHTRAISVVDQFDKPAEALPAEQTGHCQFQKGNPLLRPIFHLAAEPEPQPHAYQTKRHEVDEPLTDDYQQPIQQCPLANELLRPV